MKIVVSDFDLTLFRTEKELDQDIEAIHNFQKEGNLFIINTGRNLTFLIKDTSHYQIPFDYVICGDGTKIFNKNLEELYSGTIDKSYNKDILEILNSSKYIEESFIDDGFQLYQDTNVTANTIIGRLVVHHEKEAMKVLEKITKKYPTVSGYLSDNWLNLRPITCNKKNAIDWLRKENKWKKEQIYTIGDNINDIEMIKAYHGYSMNLSYPELDDISNGTFSSIKDFLEFVSKK